MLGQPAQKLTWGNGFEHSVSGYIRGARRKRCRMLKVNTIMQRSRTHNLAVHDIKDTEYGEQSHAGDRQSSPL